MPYGVTDAMWRSLPDDDRQQLINEYNEIHNPSAPQPQQGGYAPVTTAQATQALVTGGVAPQTAATVGQQIASGGGAPQTTATPGRPPQYVFAVNLPTTYPDYESMAANGQTLIVVADDPEALLRVQGAKEHHIKVAIQVNASVGQTPEQYAQAVANAKATFNPDSLVLDIEYVGKGYQGQAALPGQTTPGWDWSAQAAPLVAQAAGGTPSIVTMSGGGEDDYNYGAYQTALGPSTIFMPQAYGGDMTPTAGGADQAVANLVKNGVPQSQIVPVVGPNQSAGSGSYASFGLYTGVPGAPGSPGSAGNVGGQTSNTPYYPGQQPVAGAGSGETPGPPIFVNPGGIYGGTTPNVNAPGPPGTSTTPGGTTATPGAENWAAAYFGTLGLPTDVANKVAEIFGKYPDTNDAIAFSLAYIRGTPWYASTFPGIQDGIAHGMIANEQDYRQYVTAVNNLSQQYYKRPVAGYEIQSYLNQGLTPDIIGKQYQGEANVMVNEKDYRYYLGNLGDSGQPTDGQLTALGREQAGLDTPLGQQMANALNKALQRYSKLFEGNAATPSLSLGANGLSAPSLQGGKTKPDVAA